MSSAAWSKTNPLMRRAVVSGSLNASAGFDAAATATSGQSQMATCMLYTFWGFCLFLFVWVFCWLIIFIFIFVKFSAF